MRALFCLTLLAISAWTHAAGAAQPGPGPAPPRTNQPRYRVSSFGAWVRTNAPGYPAYRYTYRGQANGFQPPAIFTYGGLEHNEQMHGPGQLSGPWH